MGYVFVSYSHKDKNYVHKLQDALQSEGFEVWIDDRIDIGDEWPWVIQEQLDACSAFILVASENSYKSKWVQKEVTRAQRTNKPFFPLLLCGGPWLSIESIQYVDVKGGKLPPEKFYDQLGGCVKRKPSAEHPAPDKTRLPDIDSCVKEYTHEILQRPDLGGAGKYTIHLSAYLRDQRLPVERLLEESDRLVLTGSPGSGKTVLLQHLLNSYCRKIGEGAKNIQPGHPIPVYVELGMIAQRIRNRSTASNPARVLLEEVLRVMGLQSDLEPHQLFKEVASQYRLMLLLDGLNEVPPDVRENVISDILSIDTYLGAVGKKKISILVTSRIYGFSDKFSDHGYLVAELSPLTLDEIEKVFSKLPGADKTDRSIVFQSLDPRTRQLFSSPQYLNYFVDWYRESLPTGGKQNVIRNLGRTRAQILRFFCEQKLSKLPPQKALMVDQILGKLAYSLVTHSLYFSTTEAFRVINAVLQETKVSDEPDQLLEEILVSGLVVRAEDKFKFSHHSIQQYYAARQMVDDKNLEEYVKFDIWHEPLVIAAGMLDVVDLVALLKHARSQPELYAYVLSGVDQPDLEYIFVQDLVKRLVNLIWNWRRQLIRTLVVYFVIWFILLPVLGISLVMTEDPTEQVLLSILGFAYIAIIPTALIFLNKRRLRRQIRKLTDDLIPQTIIPLKVLMAKGALQRIRDQLALMRDTIRGYQLDDAGYALIAAGIRKIEHVINIPSYMTMDEMLSYLGDPMISILINTSQLTTKGFDTLCSMAVASDGDAQAFEALNLLAVIFLKDPESREGILRIFVRILEDDRYSQQRKKKAQKISEGLGISMPKQEGFLQHLAGKLLRFFSKIFSGTR